MHNNQVSTNIKNWMEHSAQRMLENEEYPMLLLSYKDNEAKGQDLMIHRGSPYTDAQIVKILQTFLTSLTGKNPING